MTSSHRAPFTRAERIAWIAFGVAAVAVFTSVFLWVVFRGQQGQISALKAQKYAAVGAATSANASLSAAGLPTVDVPTSAAAPVATVTISGPQGDTGKTGGTGPGPSDSQVAAAVVSYCSTHSCSTPPTSSDVASAVAAYCIVHNGCAGTSGAVGATGPQGPAGANATTDQIAASVQSYCAVNNNCQGPQGSPGAAGATGATGPEIASFTFTVPAQGPFGKATTYVCSAPSYSCVAQ